MRAESLEQVQKLRLAAETQLEVLHLRRQQQQDDPSAAATLPEERIEALNQLVRETGCEQKVTGLSEAQLQSLVEQCSRRINAEAAAAK